MNDEQGNVLDNPPARPSEEASDVVYSAPEATEEVVEEDNEGSYNTPIDVEVESALFNISASQEETRASIAQLFTRAFLFLVGVALVAPFLANYALPDVVPQPISASKELVTVLASVLAGPFGFIVGFYFKQNQDG
jgi:hypothetical protein